MKILFSFLAGFSVAMIGSSALAENDVVDFKSTASGTIRLDFTTCVAIINGKKFQLTSQEPANGALINVLISPSSETPYFIHQEFRLKMYPESAMHTQFYTTVNELSYGREAGITTFFDGSRMPGNPMNCRSK